MPNSFIGQSDGGLDVPPFRGSELLPTSFIGQSDGGLINVFTKKLANLKLVDEISPQQVADEGIYLNQLLLDKGAARLF